MEVKDIMKNRRLALGLTLKDVSDRVGVSEGTVSRWESGDIANMRRDRIKALSDVLDISPAVIMGWNQETPDLVLSPEERDLILAFRSASPEARVSAIMVLKANKL